MSRDYFEEKTREEQRTEEMYDAQNDKPKSKNDITGSDITKWFFMSFIALCILTLICLFSKTASNICFSLVGVLVAAYGIVHRNVMLRRCTVKVMATCIHLDRDTSGRSNSYAPLWEYSFQGMVYQHREPGYTNANLPRLGSRHELFINPDDPEEAYRDNLSTTAAMVGVGIFFILIGIRTIIA